MTVHQASHLVGIAHCGGQQQQDVAADVAQLCVGDGWSHFTGNVVAW